ncbi:MAG: glycosyltransferase family 2 protein [Acidobacteriia bacterium]|nr:glycosyltransferase family 2 protein [Terriglobia bacterium]
MEWCDDVVVLDSFSCDRTVEIAKQHGVQVFQRAFDNFAGQRNFALRQLPFRHLWVFHLDADERFTPDLQAEIERRISTTDFEAFFVPSKMMFGGKWLRNSAMYPTYQVRLIKQEGFEFTQVGHGQREAIELNRIGRLEEPYLHFSLSKGIADWVNRHDRYSTLEAAEAVQEIGNHGPDWAGLASRDSVRRRRALKALSYHLPFRSSLRFMYVFLLRRGFLDGLPGWIYCCLLAFYEQMISMKIKYLKIEKGKNPLPPIAEGGKALVR